MVQKPEPTDPGSVAYQAGYVLTSNRESGFGRYDVMLEPCSRGDDGIILEFKVFDEAEGEKASKIRHGRRLDRS